MNPKDDASALSRLAPGRRLAFRLGIRLCLGAAVILVAAGIWNLVLHREQMTDLVALSADRHVETIRRSTRSAMLRNNPEELRAIVDTIGGEPGIERIRIFDKQGRVYMSTDAAEVHQLVDKHAEQCYACHREDEPMRALDRPDRMRTFERPGGDRVLAVISPIRNEAACTACHDVHPPEQSLLGVLDVQLSLGPVDRMMAANERALGLVLAATVAALLAIAGFLVWQLILRRVRGLTEASARVGAGDLDARVEVGAPDEIGALAGQWNRMVAELQRAHRELESWSESLEERVDEKTRELENAHRHMLVVEKMASLGKLAAVVAHEINNPLAGIGTYARLLRKQIAKRGGGEGDGAETDRILSMVEEEAARCGRIVRNLLLFARAPGARFQEAQLAPMLERCVMLVRHKAELQEVDIQLEVAPDLPPVECDVSQLQQVVLVLAMNGIEAMPGGGTLTLHAAPRSGTDEIAIRVSDAGCGIPAEDLSHVFEPFYTTKEQGQGVGLGLAVAYGIVRRHHGRIEVESERGAGSTFTIVLPRTQPEGADGEEDPVEEAAARAAGEEER